VSLSLAYLILYHLWQEYFTISLDSFLVTFLPLGLLLGTTFITIFSCSICFASLIYVSLMLTKFKVYGLEKHLVIALFAEQWPVL